MNIKTVIIAGATLFFFAGNSNAQLSKLFKKKDKGGETTEKKDEPVKEEHVYSPYHTANMGKVVFYNKTLSEKSANDSEAGTITERVIADKTPFYFRAYVKNSWKGSCEGCNDVEIRYTIAGVSFTTDQLRKELPQYYGRMASAEQFYDWTNRALGVPMNCGPGKYVNNYTLQEDTYRILLSKVKDKLTPGASLTLKVEVFATKEGVETAMMATGEITLKVTDASKNPQSPNCRCGKAGMTDAKFEKAVAEAFEFQFNDVTKVHKVVLNGRDFEVKGDGKGMFANIIYERTDGVFMQAKKWVYYKINGASYSDKATIGKNVYYIPVSPTCAKK